MKWSLWFGLALSMSLVVPGCVAVRDKSVTNLLQHDAAVAHLVEACGYPTAFRNMARNFVAQSKAPINDDDAKFQMMEERIASASPHQLTPSIVNAFSKYISTQDAESVANMFESSAGQKIIASSSQGTIHSVGVDFSVLAAKLGLTEADKETMMRYAQTPAWQHYRQMVANPQVANTIMINILHSNLFTPEERKVLLGPNG